MKAPNSSDSFLGVVSHALFCRLPFIGRACLNTNQEHHRQRSSKHHMQGWVCYSPTTGKYEQIRSFSVCDRVALAQSHPWASPTIRKRVRWVVHLKLAELALLVPILEPLLRSTQNRAREVALHDRAGLLSGRALRPSYACQVYRRLKAYKDEYRVIKDIFLQNVRVEARR